MTTLEQHEQAVLVRQRDDAIDNAKALAPVAQAAVNLLRAHYEDPTGGAEYQAAWTDWRDTTAAYIEEYGAEVDA
ncbi:hypothetical protein [Oerskovia sp. Root22]|uniref:hypothetical protein n=1 Tax=Oerskovia sp. Root22 TaxID=1736494 RepID=UPI0006FC025F|nr:hypothetical protein [Oerskovia sp. Root22]KRC37492.1 hypothetical protein ASE15_05105 [Oerskovia sp. Root22]